MNELESSGVKDQALIDNLKYMMEAGFTNFQVNKSLLMRNNNDVAVAINLLCNGMVTDSMFLGQQWETFWLSRFPLLREWIEIFSVNAY